MPDTLIIIVPAWATAAFFLLIAAVILGAMWISVDAALRRLEDRVKRWIMQDEAQGGGA